VSLLTELLDEPPQQEARFGWAVGDVSPRTGRAVQLPFDAYWRSRNLLVEIDEDQHSTPTPHFDKPDVLTVSGVHRGDQRRLYDARKRAAARDAGFTLIEIPWPRRPPPGHRDRAEDLATVRLILEIAGVLDNT
jgi:hypothetical protein